MIVYIQRRDLRTGQRETVDEFTSRREALAMVQEYRLADRSADYYLSQRACREWKEASR